MTAKRLRAYRPAPRKTRPAPLGRYFLRLALIALVIIVLVWLATEGSL